MEGARPDVEAAYPSHPQNSKAGWGYMLLTNMLPSGDGSYSLLAYAVNLYGREVLLGSRAVTVDNASAVLPFGAIDTPAQGGTASGAAYLNFGWVLTPQPNMIPIDGSTITVWVDGLPLGHPLYNNYRADIAGLFPGYANSNGAVGVFTLDTAAYANGIHTIAWSAVDTGSNVDGIGSRYFSIQNAGGSPAPAAVSGSGRPVFDSGLLRPDGQAPVYLKRGFADDPSAEAAYPEADGWIRTEIPAVSRLAVYVNQGDSIESGEERKDRARRIRREAAASSEAGRYAAYEIVLGELRPLPIGASIDARDGILYWQPGPGFSGEYRFVIVDREAGTKKSILVTIR